LGRALVLGVRPERVELALGDKLVRSRWTLKAKIVSIENAGADKFVHASCQVGTFVARVPSATRLEINKECVFSIDLGQARLFDVATGEALL
jgi:ABC-type sugar transport system ATPase subunit